MRKVLVIRFSSIGDIVLTSPVVRCLKLQMPDAEIHFTTKKTYQSIVESNPYIDKVLVLEDELKVLISDLKAEKYDVIIDLHNNLRTRIIKSALKVKSHSFNKLNIQKFILTNFKKNILPNIHIIERYLETVKALGVKNDGKGLDYFIPTSDEMHIEKLGLKRDYIAMVIGAKFQTKRLPIEKIIEICGKINMPIVLLGGAEEKSLGIEIKNALDRNDVLNTCGTLSLNQSASIIKQASTVVTHDTGLMHIAAAFDKKIISIWGNTVPSFGMYPFVEDEKNIIVEVENLPCRPCSKIGYDKCPKQHFNCMNQIDINTIISNL